MSVERIELWRGRLKEAALPALRGTPAVAPTCDEATKHAFIESFADESGHRRPVDGSFLSAMLGIGSSRRGWMEDVRKDPDVELWRCVTEGTSAGNWRIPPWVTREGRAPMTGEWTDGPIEVWTEREFSCLHAAWSLGRNAGHDGHGGHGPGWLRGRCLSAASYLMEHVQPDNGTNHPWAVHVFAWMWAMEQDLEAGMYAETLLHNSLAGRGRPDLFSACILWHAAGNL